MSLLLFWFLWDKGLIGVPEWPWTCCYALVSASQMLNNAMHKSDLVDGHLMEPSVLPTKARTDLGILYIFFFFSCMCVICKHTCMHIYDVGVPMSQHSIYHHTWFLLPSLKKKKNRSWGHTEGLPGPTLSLQRSPEFLSSPLPRCAWTVKAPAWAGEACRGDCHLPRSSHGSLGICFSFPFTVNTGSA